MNSRILLFLLTFTLVIASCNKKDDTDEKMAEEELKLSDYMKNTVPDATMISDGQIYYKKTVENQDGIKPSSGNHLLLDYSISELYTDKLEYNSDVENFAILAPFYLPAYKYGGPELFMYSTTHKGFYQVVGEMKEHEIAEAYLSSRYNILPTYIDFIPRRMKIKLVKVITEDINSYQESLMRNFLGRYDNEIMEFKVKSYVDNNDYNVLYSIIDDGPGQEIKDNAIIETVIDAYYMLEKNKEVQYETDLKGTFSSENAPYTSENYFMEIFTQMKTGGRVIIAVPYILYFGNHYYIDNTTNQIKAPHSSALIFDIKINK